MKYTTDRPFADPEQPREGCSKLANEFDPFQDSRIYIEKINERFRYKEGGSPSEYGSSGSP